ncbi:MAG: AAA family ATPase, partial [Sphingopyxis sp.]
VAEMAAALAESPQTPFAKPHLNLIDPDGNAATPWGEGVLRDVLAGSRGRDASVGRALLGPHRTDLAVAHAATGQAAARCSTGEQKALLLSIVLVAAQRGARPILLLDELAAHLDPARRAALFARLTQAGGQVWMTGTELALFDAAPDGATRWLVHAGHAPQQA